MEEHKKLGGNPDVDVSIFYLTNLFLDKKPSEKIIKDYNIPVLTENADIIRILKEAYICNINPNDFY